MKKLILLVLLTCLYKTAAFGQVFQWAKIQGEYAPSITADSSNFYTTGGFTNSITLGNQTFTNQAIMTGYLAKHNEFGTVLWAKHVQGADRAFNVKTDADHNVILTGMYRDSLYIDSLIFSPASSAWSPDYRGVFILKFNSSGSLIWAKRSVSWTGYLTNTLSIDTDNNKNIVISGTYSNSISFNNTTITGLGQEDIFLVKYDQNGNFQWLKSSGGSTHDQQPIVKCGINNEVFLKFLTHAGSGIALTFTLKKYNSSGIEAWAKTISDAYADGLGTDVTGNIYVAGSSGANLTFDNIILPLSGSQIFLAKINSSGNWIWAKKIVTGNYSATSVSLGNNVNNKFGISGFVAGNPIIGNMPFTATSKNRFIGYVDTTGTISSPQIITQQGVELYPSAGTGIVSDLSGNSFLSGGFGGMAVPQMGSITLGPLVLNTGTTTIGSNTFPWHSTGYLTKITDEVNEVKGNLFIDTNGNGIKDGTEAGFPNGMIEVTPGLIYSNTDTNGDFSMYLPSGTFTFTVLQPSIHYTLPQNQSVTFGGVNQTSIKNFALVPIPNRNDVKIAVTNISPARPGFPLKYQITFENVGTTTLSDTISLNHNTNFLNYVSSSMPPASQMSGKIKWFYQALEPNEKRSILVDFNVLANTPLGTSLSTIASIKPLTTDFTPINNYDTLNLIVTGSYDPNDKQVNHSTLLPNQVTTEYLDYTIRFQNTGTDTAFTVIIRDAITSKLFMPSLELLSASHNYTFNILENNVAEWRFDNILLPDSNRNEPASHGFVRFRMRPQHYLQLGDSITNFAAIYFDYNAPIITNTVVTRIMQPLGIKEEKAGLTTLYLYPNPATEILTVEAELKKPQATNIILRNVLGQEVYRKSLGNLQQVNHKIDIRNLPKGVYLLQLQTGANQVSRRVVVQ